MRESVPTVDMNPVLLKPETGMRTQVVVMGKSRGSRWTEYRATARREREARIVARSLQTLRENYQVVVIEGAGSPAEINLSADDLVNMHVARIADAPVVLVGDIDRGGVFARLVGTVELIPPGHRERVRGMCINKFRGDVRLLDGVCFLEERTGIPVLGVLPHINGLRLPDEDAARLDDLAPAASVSSPVTIGIVHLPRISNYTDFEPLEHEPDVTVHYLTDPASAPALDVLDVLIVPGTKSTVSDLSWLSARRMGNRALSPSARRRPGGRDLRRLPRCWWASHPRSSRD